MTGNNAVEMETTAIYDAKTKEFIVNTPHPLAQKYWITNGAVHAKHVVVMAQLFVDGKNEGIHAILVRMRDTKHTVTSIFQTSLLDLKNVHFSDLQTFMSNLELNDATFDWKYEHI